MVQHKSIFVTVLFFVQMHHIFLAQSAFEKTQHFAHNNGAACILHNRIQ